jgi:uncharacterized SAM-dependent methyltransferase
MPRYADRRNGWELSMPAWIMDNLAPAPPIDLLRRFRRIWGTAARPVIGIDLRQDRRLLDTAYDQDTGVTVRFDRES